MVTRICLAEWVGRLMRYFLLHSRLEPGTWQALDKCLALIWFSFVNVSTSRLDTLSRWYHSFHRHLLSISLYRNKQRGHKDEWDMVPTVLVQDYYCILLSFLQSTVKHTLSRNHTFSFFFHVLGTNGASEKFHFSFWNLNHAQFNKQLQVFSTFENRWLNGLIRF